MSYAATVEFPDAAQADPVRCLRAPKPARGALATLMAAQAAIPMFRWYKRASVTPTIGSPIHADFAPATCNNGETFSEDRTQGVSADDAGEGGAGRKANRGGDFGGILVGGPGAEQAAPTILPGLRRGLPQRPTSLPRKLFVI